MSRKRLIVIIGLWLASSALSAEAVTLRYSLQEGTELTYRVQVASTSRMSGMRDEKIEIRTRINQTFRLKVTKVLADKKMEIEQEILAGKLTMTAGGEEVEGPLPTGKRKFRVSPLGRVTFVAKQSAETAESVPHCEEHGECTEAGGSSPQGFFGPGGEAIQVDFLMPSIFVLFPEKEVGPGDIWENEIELKSWKHPLFLSEHFKPTVLKVRSELLELTQHNNRECAHIRTNWDIPLSPEGSASISPSNVEVAGKVRGEAEWYFDYRKSFTCAAEGSVQVFMKASGESPWETEEPRQAETVMSVMKANINTLLVGK
ncbi:MAG: hypothetical protein GTO55_07760 [Armatimonadetes bacterium]|nr:hypothetical protein [Armatimonadota bacterium]NIM24159.1 hypothetical protein [Armatimonadota bacterium]NIM68018.1 hypothetical protein [Armatimonadota bacterium]NIM76513.1 hypothetical protein [Armatimonadota bacterium]NIN06252.1 hypothetical protein [Armatimonadota bacterium]